MHELSCSRFVSFAYSDGTSLHPCRSKARIIARVIANMNSREFGQFDEDSRTKARRGDLEEI